MAPAGPDEVQRPRGLDRDAVDGPAVIARRGDLAPEVPAAQRIVALGFERVHAVVVVAVVAVAGGEVDVPAAAHALQFGRPDLAAAGAAGRRAPHRHHFGRADGLQARGARDAQRPVRNAIGG